MPQATTAEPSANNAKVVEGSDGLLLEVDGQIVPNYDATLHPFREGDVVSGYVVRIDADEVLVDIGYKSEGVIPASELSIRKSVDPGDEVHLGEQVDALVLTKEDQDGRLILSKKRARFEKAWRRIEAAAESGEPVEGQVIEVVKGGLIIDLGVRGFLPASLVDIRRVPNLDEYMGQTIECKVIELNRSRNNVVLSRRAVLEEQRKEDRERILDRLHPGDVVQGKISNIVDFGAFVDLDGIDGLIHISELSWSHVNHPSEILSIGDEVTVKVLDIDRDRQRISLGLKQTQEDPGSGSSIPTTSATSSREPSPRSSLSAPSSRSSTAWRGSSTFPSSLSTTSRTRASSCSRATWCGSRSSRSIPTGAVCRCRSSGWRDRSCPSGPGRKRRGLARGHARARSFRGGVRRDGRNPAQDEPQPSSEPPESSEESAEVAPEASADLALETPEEPPAAEEPPAPEEPSASDAIPGLSAEVPPPEPPQEES